MWADAKNKLGFCKSKDPYGNTIIKTILDTGEASRGWNSDRKFISAERKDYDVLILLLFCGNYASVSFFRKQKHDITST